MLRGLGMKWIPRIALALLTAYLALLAALFAVMHRPIAFGRVMAHVPGPAVRAIPFKRLWLVARAGGLKVGGPAPDFILPTSDKKSYVKLSAWRGQKPVILIFGSYS